MGPSSTTITTASSPVKTRVSYQPYGKILRKRLEVEERIPKLRIKQRKITDENLNLVSGNDTEGDVGGLVEIMSKKISKINEVYQDKKKIFEKRTNFSADFSKPPFFILTKSISENHAGALYSYSTLL